MNPIDQLDGFIYHMVHIANLSNIFQRQALLSQEIQRREGIVPRSIAYNSVQNKRRRIFIRDGHTDKYRSLHSYVPFYFSTHPPMLYVQHNAGRSGELVIFKVARSMLSNQGVVFTDGNATNQQLSQNGTESVYITPAANFGDSCIRKYHPDGPRGTNSCTSNFYCDIQFLNNFDWRGINDERYIEDWEESKRVRSAEVLVPDKVPIMKIRGIAVGAAKMREVVNSVIYKCGVMNFVPQATYEPTLFLNNHRDISQ